MLNPFLIHHVPSPIPNRPLKFSPIFELHRWTEINEEGQKCMLESIMRLFAYLIHSFCHYTCTMAWEWCVSMSSRRERKKRFLLTHESELRYCCPYLYFTSKTTFGVYIWRHIWRNCIQQIHKADKSASSAIIYTHIDCMLRKQPAWVSLALSRHLVL